MRTPASDAVALAANGGQLEVVGRVDEQHVIADRAPADDAQRVEDVRDRRGGERFAVGLAASAESLDEFLHVAAP